MVILQNAAARILLRACIIFLPVVRRKTCDLGGKMVAQ